jgi:hypothetical protein
VTTYQTGDRVSSIPAFSISEYANFGETAILPERGLMFTPERFTPAQGTSFAFAYFTDYFGLLLEKNALLLTQLRNAAVT